MKSLLITSAIVGLVLSSGLVLARHGGFCAGGEIVHNITGFVSYKLGLGEEQGAKLAEFVDQLGALRQSWAAGRADMSDEVESLLAAPALDRERALQLVEERQRAMADYAAKLVDDFADFSDSLEPEQRTALIEMVRARMQDRCGPGAWPRGDDGSAPARW